MPWIAVMVCAMPFAIAALFLCLSKYGDAYFLTDERYQLNNPDDPRITRLRLK